MFNVLVRQVIKCIIITVV